MINAYAVKASSHLWKQAITAFLLTVNYGPQELCKLQTAAKYNLIVPCLTVLARYEAKYINVPSEAGRMSPSWDVSLFERQNWIKHVSPDP